MCPSWQRERQRLDNNDAFNIRHQKASTDQCLEYNWIKVNTCHNRAGAALLHSAQPPMRSTHSDALRMRRERWESVLMLHRVTWRERERETYNSHSFCTTYLIRFKYLFYYYYYFYFCYVHYLWGAQLQLLWQYKCIVFVMPIKHT